MTMENLTRPSAARPGSFTLLATVVLLSFAAAFMSQAGARDYHALFQSVLQVLCLPQLVVLCALAAYAPRKLAIVGLASVLVSWLFVAELGLRVRT
jgi:ABC-type dipeptide/oligopeptide/nickel transport system permease subunit